MSFGIVQHLKETEELKKHRVRTDFADADYNDRVTIMVEVEGVEGEFPVICEMEVEEPWRGDDGAHPAVATVKDSWTKKHGLPFPLTKAMEKQAVEAFWAKQEAE